MQGVASSCSGAASSLCVLSRLAGMGSLVLLGAPRARDTAACGEVICRSLGGVIYISSLSADSESLLLLRWSIKLYFHFSTAM